MKKLFKDISQFKRIFIFGILFTSSISAKMVARGIVTDISGKVFVTRNEKTVLLKHNDFLYNFDEIFTQIGAQISFHDYFDHRFHLSGSGYIKILNKMIELKSGYLWAQSLEKSSSPFYVQTINSTITYTQGEFIASFDIANGKTQFLSLKGVHQFKNNMNEYLNREIPKGKFSFISENYEQGSPRYPTPISKKTYEMLISLFHNIKMLDESRNKMLKESKYFEKRENISLGRNIASIDSVNHKTGGMIILIEKKRETREERDKKISQFNTSKIKELKEKRKKKPRKFKPQYIKKSNVPFKIFQVPKMSTNMNMKMKKNMNDGMKMKENMNMHMSESMKMKENMNMNMSDGMKMKKKIEMKANRSITSIIETKKPAKMNTNAFEHSLIDEYKNQMRHSKEVNSLIKELKSFDQDYQSSY